MLRVCVRFSKFVETVAIWLLPVSNRKSESFDDQLLTLLFGRKVVRFYEYFLNDWKRNSQSVAPSNLVCRLNVDGRMEENG